MFRLSRLTATVRERSDSGENTGSVDHPLTLRSALIAAILCWQVALPAISRAQDVHFDQHEGSVTDVRFLARDELAASTGSDGTLRIWNSRSGKSVRRYDAHTGPANCLAVSANQRWLASGGQDNALRVWPAPARHPEITVSLGTDNARSIRRPREGEFFYVVTDRQLQRIHDSAGKGDAYSEDSAAEVLWTAAAGITAFQLRPDDLLHAIGLHNGDIVLFSPLLKQVITKFHATDLPVQALLFIGDDVLVVDDAGQARQFRIATGSEEEVSQPAIVKEFALFDDATASASNGMVRAHQSTGRIVSVTSQTLLVLAADGRPIVSRTLESTGRLLCLSDDGQRAVVGLKGGGLQMLPLSNNSPPQNLVFDGVASAAVFSSDGRRLVVANDNGMVSVFVPATNDVNGPWTVQQQLQTKMPVRALVFAAGDDAVWLANAEQQLSRWHCADPVQYRQFNHGGPVYSVAFTPDDQFVVSAGADQTVRVWSLETGQQKFQMRGHQGSIHAIAVAADGSLAYTAGSDGTLRVWDIVSGRQLKQLTVLPATMYSLLLDGERQRLWAAGGDRQIYSIDLQDGSTKQVLEGHRDFIHRLCWQQAGQRFVSYGYAGTLKIWDAGTAASVHESQIGQVGNSADISQDGRRIAVATGQAGASIREIP